MHIFFILLTIRTDALIFHFTLARVIKFHYNTGSGICMVMKNSYRGRKRVELLPSPIGPFRYSDHEELSAATKKLPPLSRSFRWQIPSWSAMFRQVLSRSMVHRVILEWHWTGFFREGHFARNFWPVIAVSPGSLMNEISRFIDS